MTAADDGLVIGRIYTFRFRSRNQVGWSVWSDFLRVGFGNQVLAPQNLVANLELGTATSITLEWAMVTDADLVTDGYALEMLLDDDTWSEVFRAETDPNALTATVYGLTTSKLYFFRVFALDFNGMSEPSSTYQIHACGLPRYFNAPTYV